jgi:hypothetical protein
MNKVLSIKSTTLFFNSAKKHHSPAHTKRRVMHSLLPSLSPISHEQDAASVGPQILVEPPGVVLPLDTTGLSATQITDIYARQVAERIPSNRDFNRAASERQLPLA